MTAEEKKRVFEEAVSEIKEAYVHFQRYDALFKEIGITVCPNFMRKDNGDVLVHVYTGVENVFGILGVDPTVEEWGTKNFKTKLSTSLDGLDFFQLEEGDHVVSNS